MAATIHLTEEVIIHRAQPTTQVLAEAAQTLRVVLQCLTTEITIIEEVVIILLPDQHLQAALLHQEVVAQADHINKLNHLETTLRLAEATPLRADVLLHQAGAVPLRVEAILRLVEVIRLLAEAILALVAVVVAEVTLLQVEAVVVAVPDADSN